MPFFPSAQTGTVWLVAVLSAVGVGCSERIDGRYTVQSTGGTCPGLGGPVGVSVVPVQGTAFSLAVYASDDVECNSGGWDQDGFHWCRAYACRFDAGSSGDFVCETVRDAHGEVDFMGRAKTRRIEVDIAATLFTDASGKAAEESCWLSLDGKVDRQKNPKFDFHFGGT